MKFYNLGHKTFETDFNMVSVAKSYLSNSLNEWIQPLIIDFTMTIKKSKDISSRRISTTDT